MWFRTWIKGERVNHSLLGKFSKFLPTLWFSLWIPALLNNNTICSQILEHWAYQIKVVPETCCVLEHWAYQIKVVPETCCVLEHWAYQIKVVPETCCVLEHWAYQIKVVPETCCVLEHWAYQIKVIPETCCVHQIWYLCFFINYRSILNFA